MRTELWLESQNRRDHSDGLGVDGRIILKWRMRWDIYYGYRFGGCGLY
jgi:hypothetical protein